MIFFDMNNTQLFLRKSDQLFILWKYLKVRNYVLAYDHSKVEVSLSPIFIQQFENYSQM